MEAQTSVEQTNPVTIYNNAVATFQNGGEILEQNRSTAAKMVSVGQDILNQIQAKNGVMDAEADLLLSTYIVQANTRIKQMEEARKPLTQMMTAVSKLFTTEEKLADDILRTMQEYRNTWVKQCADAQRQKEEEARQKHLKEQELIRVKGEVERFLVLRFRDHMNDKIIGMNAGFNAITLETFDGKRASILAFEPVYQFNHFKDFAPQIRHSLTPAEFGNIVTNVTAGRFDGFTDEFKKSLGELKQSLLDRLPSKKAELERIRDANAEEAIKLQEAQAQRERDEELKRQQDEEAKRLADEQAIASKQAEESTMASFQQVVEAAPTEAAPEARQGFEIIVGHPVGFIPIIALYMEKEGNKLTVEKLGNTKLDAMKTFCEKLAHKTGEKIESPHLVYEPTFKAINRAQK